MNWLILVAVLAVYLEVSWWVAKKYTPGSHRAATCPALLLYGCLPGMWVIARTVDIVGVFRR